MGFTPFVLDTSISVRVKVWQATGAGRHRLNLDRYGKYPNIYKVIASTSSNFGSHYIEYDTGERVYSTQHAIKPLVYLEFTSNPWKAPYPDFDYYMVIAGGMITVNYSIWFVWLD